MKRFNEMMNIGRAKYVINYHDGVKKHGDGSPFFDIEIFSNKCKKELRVKELRQQGYRTIGSTPDRQALPLCRECGKPMRFGFCLNWCGTDVPGPRARMMKERARSNAKARCAARS